MEFHISDNKQFERVRQSCGITESDVRSQRRNISDHAVDDGLMGTEQELAGPEDTSSTS